jgi:hypothetical protein
VERYYTIPIEVGLAATPGVDVIRSTSFYGLSFVRVVFQYADEAGRLNLRRDSTGETDVLLQVDGCLREREIVVNTGNLLL